MKNLNCFTFIKLLFIGCIVMQSHGQIQENTSLDSVVYLSDVKNTIRLKMLIQKDNTLFMEEYRQKIKKATSLLRIAPFSVTFKESIPPSGDKRDYLSLAPYWWPDPSQPDGVPWIRRDGEINPATRGNNVDIKTKKQFFNAFKTVSWAALISGEEKFIDKAEELLQAWFVDPKTAMNPNLKYAQGIPGLNTGRGFGIIEFAGFSDILTYVELMDHFQLMDKQLVLDFNKWAEKYLTWLQTSELGKFEQSRTNNHGTWYDVQVVSILLYLRKIEEAKVILEKIKTDRIPHQIEADGSQPHELKRTKSLSYSTMNLRAFTKLAFFGKRTQIDLWNYTSNKGASIKKAYHFLLPYASGELVWNYRQISDTKKAKDALVSLFQTTACQFPLAIDKLHITVDNNDVMDSCSYLLWL